jgi:hypothetical protein
MVVVVEKWGASAGAQHCHFNSGDFLTSFQIQKQQQKSRRRRCGGEEWAWCEVRTDAGKSAPPPLVSLFVHF